MKRLFLLSLLVLFWSLTAQAEVDSLRTEAPALRRQPWEWGLSTLPFMGMAATVAPSLDATIRELRMQSLPTFRYHYDDYLQFSPLALQLSAALIGLEGSHASPYELLTAEALSVATTLILVNSTKWLTHRLRPDGSSANSFPSGHTATAFMGAELLDIEYGACYPWLSALGYSAAYATGVGRILNNRHWASDVWAGAGVGILSAQIGSILSDLLWGKKGTLLYEIPSSEDLPRTLSIQYATSQLTQHYYKASIRQAIRNEVALLFPVLSEDGCLLDCGVAGGNLLQISGYDVPNNTDWFVGFKGDLSYYPSPRIAFGAAPFYYISPAAPSAPGCVLLGELGVRAHLDYNIRSHRSFRFFVGASHTTAYHLSKERGVDAEDDVVSYPLRLSFEAGVALLLHL